MDKHELSSIVVPSGFHVRDMELSVSPSANMSGQRLALQMLLDIVADAESFHPAANWPPCQVFVLMGKDHATQIRHIWHQRNLSGTASAESAVASLPGIEDPSQA